MALIVQKFGGTSVKDAPSINRVAGIVAETGEKTGSFVLLRPPEKITVGEIVSAIADAGTPPEALGLSKTQGPLRDFFAQSDSQLSEHLSVSIAKLASPPEGGNAS